MRVFLVVATLFLSATNASAKVSIGGLLSTPEVAGAYVSIWPHDGLSIDLRATLATVDGGITGHIPLSGEISGGRHDILLTGMGGFVHDGVAVHSWYSSRGPRILGALGYGYQSAWDFRLLGGVTAYDSSSGWATAPTFIAMLGHAI